MTDLHEFTNPFESFKQGRPEAFRYYFHLHNYRIYCYLLQLLVDRQAAQDLTSNAFIVLFRINEQLNDAEEILPRLYWHARVGYLLRSKGKRSADDLERELVLLGPRNIDIMDDPGVARNETLIALQRALQKLPPMKREVVELFFFQGLSIRAIARQLNLDEESVKEYISQSLKRLGEELSGKATNKNNCYGIRG